ncbi:hypothetical protein GI584_05200 [Gracilibacillus salitolerans]|uniref:Glycoside Hydrolase 20C C-terminal domain-containing protein n=2 Tax=Gracilibacillus salitolerans TaxID=2663022 RepID=A0A5Q2TF79_9BACI|nr:hypothetical protein GI584_05200 [Gracilibacillus salitolerans]
MQKLVHQVPELKQRIESPKTLHYAQSMDINKPFGREEMDVRYGGLLARIDTARHRLAE